MSLVRPVALALTAHPDDAELYCSGALLLLADRGWEVHVATVTPGDCGALHHPREEIARIRKAEATRAAEMLGATYHCLDEPDGLVVYDRPTLQKTIDLFRRIAPTVLLTHPPVDYHSDHEFTSRLARAAAFVHPAPNASSVPLLPGTAIPHLYYCDTPDGNDHAGKTVEPTLWLDITPVFERKLELVRCHESQHEWLLAHHHTDLEAPARSLAEKRGLEKGVPRAEAYVQMRAASYPKDDLLGQLLGAL